MGGERKRRLRRFGWGCGALSLLLVVTLSIWVRDEPPSDFSDLEPQYRVEIAEGVPTVMEGLELFLTKVPAVPKRLEDLESELGQAIAVRRLSAIPFEARQDPRLRESLRAYCASTSGLLRELESALSREYIGRSKTDLEGGDSFGLDTDRLLEIERALSLAAQLEGQTEEATRGYARILQLSRRWREEGAISFVSHLTSLRLETNGWRALEELRHDGPLDPILERQWLSWVPPEPPEGIDLAEVLRWEFESSLGFFREFDESEDSWFSRLIFKKNRYLRLAGDAARSKIAYAQLSPVERRERELRIPETSVFESLFNFGGKELLEITFIGFDSMLSMSDRLSMVREAGRLLLAFDRYQRENGSLPETLDALQFAVPELNPFPIDPYSGNRFFYDPKRRIFWSVGEDGASQGATVMPDRAAGVDPWSLIDPTWQIPERN